MSIFYLDLYWLFSDCDNKKNDGPSQDLSWAHQKENIDFFLFPF